MTLNAGQEIIDGVVLAAVAGGVGAGTELGPSATDGELASGSDGYAAITAEGDAAGLLTSEAIPTGHAGVPVDGTVTYEAGETLSPGDAVGIDGGQLRAANSGDGSPNPVAIVAHGGGEDGGEDYASGDEVPVHLLN